MGGSRSTYEAGIPIRLNAAVEYLLGRKIYYVGRTDLVFDQTVPRDHLLRPGPERTGQRVLHCIRLLCRIGQSIYYRGVWHYP